MIKKTISLTISLIMLFSSTIGGFAEKNIDIYKTVYESSDHTISFSPNSNFIEAKNDEILLYFDDGTSLKKKDLLKENKIPNNFIEKFKNNNKNKKNNVDINQLDNDNNDNNDIVRNPMLRATIESRKKSALVVKILGSARFRQVTQDYYCSPSRGHIMAQSLNDSNTNSGVNIVITLFGFVVKRATFGTTSAIYSIYGEITNAIKNQTATQIRSYATNNKPSRLRLMKTTYGSFSAVDSWDGKNIDTTTINNQVTKEYIDSIVSYDD